MGALVLSGSTSRLRRIGWGWSTRELTYGLLSQSLFATSTDPQFYRMKGPQVQVALAVIPRLATTLRAVT